MPSRELLSADVATQHGAKVLYFPGTKPLVADNPYAHLSDAELDRALLGLPTPVVEPQVDAVPPQKPSIPVANPFDSLPNPTEAVNLPSPYLEAEPVTVSAEKVGRVRRALRHIKLGVVNFFIPRDSAGNKIPLAELPQDHRARVHERRVVAATILGGVVGGGLLVGSILSVMSVIEESAPKGNTPEVSQPLPSSFIHSGPTAPPVIIRPRAPQVGQIPVRVVPPVITPSIPPLAPVGPSATVTEGTQSHSNLVGIKPNVAPGSVVDTDNVYPWQVAHQLQPGNETQVLVRALTAYNTATGSQAYLGTFRDTVVIYVDEQGRMADWEQINDINRVLVQESLSQ